MEFFKMSISIGKKLKRIACVAFAGVMMGATALTFTSCESSNPKVTLNIEFNNKTYSISYKLYRKFFPQTVRHFLELAENGYYEDLVFHDYNSIAMYTGAYEYQEDNTEQLHSRNYFDWLQTNNVTLTQTVYTQTADGIYRGTDTVVGEFASNNYTITNNDNKIGSEKRGGLVMYYSDKDSARDNMVTVRRASARSESDEDAYKLAKVSYNVSTSSSDVTTEDAKWFDARKYSYNSATSIFYLTNSNNSTVNKNYCVFGEPYDSDATDVYNSLYNAINAYITAEYPDEPGDFTEEKEVHSDANDWYYGSYNLKATYNTPKTPIVLKSVKINRY